MTAPQIESLVIHTHPGPCCTVEYAPPVAAFSLELIQQADPRELRVDRDLLHVADQVTYRVTGWQGFAVTAELFEDRRKEDR